MRSRYSAYALGLSDYLLATWHPSTRPASLDLHGQPPLRWLGLDVAVLMNSDIAPLPLWWKPQPKYSADFDKINNLQDFKTKKIDEELRSVINEDNNNNSSEITPKKFVISDAIPLIIAEFIHENINIAILLFHYITEARI